MAEKNTGLGLPQTRGSFEVRGIVTGTEKDNFFTEKETRNGKTWRSVNFGVQYSDDATMYVGINGMERDEVYFTKRPEEKGGKTITEKVPWKDRFTFAKEGFSLLGVNLGVSKTVDDKGKEVNDRKRMVEYDACGEIADNLKDGQTVFVRGNMEYSEYNGRHQTRFMANQVSLARDLDFEVEGFEPTANFQQVIVFMNCTPNEDKTKAVVEAKVVNFDNIQDTEFIVYDMGLARQLKKGLKPYQSIEVWGYVNVAQQVDEVEETDCWGSANKMKRVNAPTIRELVIIGADPDTIDKDTYSEEKIDEAIEKVKASKAAMDDFGGSNASWGSANNVTDEDEEW